MDYRKFGDSYYLRLDRGDEVVSSILELCRCEGVRSAVFSGIGGCGEAVIQVFHPESGEFKPERVESLLELVSLNGNVIWAEDETLSCHAHALFTYQDEGQARVLSGHLKSTTVLYTAEIELRPVIGGVIHGARDVETNTNFWAFPADETPADEK